MMGIRIDDGKNSTDVYFNLLADGRIDHRNSINTVNGWDTDALITAVTFPSGADRENLEASTQIFMSHGSYLRKKGVTLVDSLSKIFMVAEKSTEGLNVVLQGQPRLNVTLHAAQKPGKLTLNNAEVPINYDATSHTLKLQVVPTEQK